MLRRILGAQWLAIAFVGGVSFVLSVFIARRFGPEIFGVYAQAISLGSLVGILVDGGFGKLLIRETVQTSPALAGHEAELHGFAFGHACTAIALLALLAIMNPFSLHWPTLLATVGAFGGAVLGNFSMAILRGQGRLMRDALWQMGSRTLTAACMAVVLWGGGNAPWEVLTAQFIGAGIFLLLLMRKGWVRPLFRVPRQIYAVVIPLIWLDLATVIYFRSDMLLFKLLNVSKADVGAYGVAYRLIDAFLLLATPVGLLLFRRFRLNANTLSRLNLIRIVRLAILASGVGLLIFLLALPTADLFFRLVFGEGFALAGNLFKVLCLMLVFALTNGVLGQGVFALGLDRHYVWTATVAAIFNVAGNLLLMSTYGVWAAVWMTVATELVLGIGLSAALIVAWKRMQCTEQVG